jgi:hypothetical protein
MLLGKLDFCMQKTEMRPCTNINSNGIKDFNTRLETLKLVWEIARNTLELTGIGNDFLSRTQMAQKLRKRIDKWDYTN